MTAITKISVRALAFGGKFVGQHVGFATIDIYGPEDSGTPLESGLTDQGLVENTDGSGVTALIMSQPYPWVTRYAPIRRRSSPLKFLWSNPPY